MQNYSNAHKSRKVISVIAEKLKEVDFNIIVGPAMGGVIVSYELARQTNKPGIFAERKEGVMCIRRGFEIKKEISYNIRRCSNYRKIFFRSS